MKITKTILALSAAAAVTVTANAQEGRQLDTIADPTEIQFLDSVGGAPFGVGPVVGIFWDERCAQVEYTFNSNAGANVGTGAEIAPEVLADVVQQGLDRWNAIPTSYIEMNITSVEDLGNRPRVAGDFINEVTFITAAGFGALASSPSTTLLADSTFAPGDDLDGDGDSDVFDPAVEGINKCSDVDDDGDIEFPAGDYAAGTILDNDVQFGAGVFWELGATNTGGADVDAVSTHEFGHSHGHNHSLINQISADDGTASTMFPFIDTGDGAAEIGSRSLSIDDIAVSSFIYPEGSSESGISALQDGDIAFDDAFDVLEGSVSRDGGPILGAHVSAITVDGGVTVSGTYSGSSVVFFDLFGVIAPGGLFAFQESAVDGNFALAVPKDTVYKVALESLDGDPAATGNISVNAIVGGILGQNDLAEEQYSRGAESNIEQNPMRGASIFSGNSSAKKIDFIANEEIVQRNAEAINFIGTGALAAAAADTFLYAQSFDRDDVLARLALGDLPVSVNFRTGTLDASLVPRFASAQLAIGYANEDGTATIKRVIRRGVDFVGQDGDSTPFVLRNPKGVASAIRKALEGDENLQVFALLEARVSELPVGPSGFPPAFLALDIDTTGQSYESIDGAPLTLRGGNWDIELRYINLGE